MAKQQTNASLVSDSGAAKSAYATPEERAAYIKQQAEKRMNERLAKLGITRKSKSTEQKPPVESKSVSNHSPVRDSEVKLVTRNANEVEVQNQNLILNQFPRTQNPLNNQIQRLILTVLVLKMLSQIQMMILLVMMMMMRSTKLF